MPYVVNETRQYTPDFLLESSGVVVECKGRLTVADRKKLVLVKKQYPRMDLRLLFQFDNKLSPRSPTRYSVWATKHGFPWAVGAIPEEWLL